jgi:hypothetical protein
MTVDHCMLLDCGESAPWLFPLGRTTALSMLLPQFRHMMQAILSDAGPMQGFNRSTVLVRAPKMRPGDERRVNLGRPVGDFLEI